MTVDRPTALEREGGRTRSAPAAPTAVHPLSMTWRDGLFVHYPVDPDRLRPHVPDPLTLDTFEGRAYVSVLPFVLARVGLRWSPDAARISFGELNVRTYVRLRDDPGLFFFSIDVGNTPLAALVRRLTRLPVYAAAMHVGGDDERVTFASSRASRDALPARFSATYEPTGETFHAEPGTLAHWSTARRRFYAPRGSGILTAEIAHPPWPLRSADATIHENDLLEANDLPEPIDDPVCYYCGELDITGSMPRRLRPR